MQQTRNIVLPVVFSLFSLALVLPVYAQTTTPPDDITIPQVRIDTTGKASIQGLYIMQLANTTMYAKTSWDQSVIRWLIKTNKSTNIKKRFGDPMSVFDINPGDYISVEGYIEGGTSLSLIATSVTDWSNYTSQSTFSGKITDIQNGGLGFTLARSSGNPIAVSLSTSTVIYRNRRELLPQYLRVGDSVTSITGTYDTIYKQLNADRIVVYINPGAFAVQNFQGTLKTLPADMQTGNFVLTIAGKDYTVSLLPGAAILSSKRIPTTFNRYLIGDTVRVYGSIRQDDDSLDTINASLVRDINF